MSGHSKWANIQNKKNKTDAARGKIFTKIGREIAIAVKEGGGDPANNAKLRDVIAKAKANNMPNDNINRSIKKAMGEGSGASYEEITYEGYGPGGTAVIVEVVTDNRNRTAAEIRHIFDKSGGSMGASGCVAWMFDKKGRIGGGAQRHHRRGRAHDGCPGRRAPRISSPWTTLSRSIPAQPSFPPCGKPGGRGI